VRGAGWGARGATSVEYALMVAIVVLLLVGGVAALFDAVRERFDRDAGCAATAYRGEGCPVGRTGG
jgi:Flp pilus assembly pilin Flp